MRLQIRAAAWARVLSHFGSPKRPRDYEEPLWLGAAPYWHRMEVRVPPEWRYLVLCTKSISTDWWTDRGRAPRDTAIVHAAAPNDPRALSVLEPLHDRASATALVGDLYPNSIVQYVETQRALRRPNRPALAYGGVDDTWLTAMERAFKPRWRLLSVSIRLSMKETTLLNEIDRAIDLDRLLGPRACEMLRSGRKIELEGAMNPAFYRPSHRRWTLRHLRSLLRRASMRMG